MVVLGEWGAIIANHVHELEAKVTTNSIWEGLETVFSHIGRRALLIGERICCNAKPIVTSYLGCKFPEIFGGGWTAGESALGITLARKGKLLWNLSDIWD